MYPLTCPNGNQHVLPANVEDKGPDTSLCENCSVTEKEYYEAETQKNNLVALTDTLVKSAASNREFAAEALFEGFAKQHRTNQQDFMRMLALLITKIATLPTDPRNEAAIMWCKKVAEIDAYFPRI